MNKPKLILFDIGGVLIEYSDVFKTAAKELDIPHEYLDKTFDKYDNEITTGKITPQELYLKCLNDYQLNSDPSYNFLLSWIKDYTTIKPTYDFLIKVSKKYDVGILSNIYKGMVPELIKQKIIPDLYYKYIFLSCEMNKQKPNDDIYKQVVNDTYLQPNEIFFIDDRDDYQQTAKKLGWQVFSFERFKPEKSVSELENRLL